ncbi:MAG: diacylglycerol kinase family protein [Acidobacteriota bacterium]|nr:diacylglycerol kinase family protein [Acidobacteriota bacterium]
MKRIAVLLNPSAAGGRALRLKPVLESRLSEAGVVCDLHVSENEAHFRRLSRDLATRTGILAAAGGDSALQILVNEIMRLEKRPAVAFIGLGSSNDIGREFETESLDKACAALRRGQRRPIDLGRISCPGTDPVWFVGQANIGLGAVVNARMEAWAGRTPHLARAQTPAGILAVMRAFRRKQVPVSLSISADGDKTIEGTFTAAVFSNIRYWATGKLIAPAARPDDGLLDACLIGDMSFLRLARIARLAGRGGHTEMPDVRLMTGRRFSISSPDGFEVQTDGLILGLGNRTELFRDITIEAVPQAIHFIA